MLRLELRYRRDEFSLDAAFTAPTPGITALYGRSGAGKTTLMHLLAGLLRPDAGLIELDGTPLFDSRRALDVPAHRRRLPCVFQDLRLFPHLSVEGNLCYGRKRIWSAAGQRARRAGPDR